ncbi:polyprenol monophosphomannose synthase [Ilumatobacter nonamiensis]|uniref:polyprenol monophosphomannose synthase n=1 Tax=Ilumatobacter nonamiensis TaxID=467093 RepID=UPI000688466B|nr:polyprenol monophosphomannose synthase [Ilumatobacter nonamiensis]
MRTLVVVPTHNEADNIAALLDGVLASAPDADVLVVDDASTDKTREIVREWCARETRLRLVERDEKLGLGSAYAHAFTMAMDEGYDAVVEIDADLSHDPVVLPMMLGLAESGIDVVIGSRYVPGGSVVGWPHRRTWLSRWGNRYAAIALGLAINDATAGYRVYRTDTLRAIDLGEVRSEGYGFQVEMTYRAVAAGCSIVEIPITFRDRVAGSSKMNGNIVREAFALVTWWAIRDAVTLRRRRRAYNVD